MLRSGHKVAVGDIVKVTNGQHLPADMVIVSSRSDSACVCVRVRACVCQINVVIYNNATGMY